MSTPVVGYLGLADPGPVSEALGGRVQLDPVEPAPGAVASAAVEAWVVHTEGLDARTLQTVRDGVRPALFLVPADQAAAWHRMLRKGVHDVAWLPLVGGEVRARLLGLLAREASWNSVSGALCREIAHDLRGPLQALHFTIAALQNDEAVAPEFQEDVDALLEAADVADLMLNGVSNLGRYGQPVPDDAPLVDLTELARKAASRRSLAEAVSFDAGEPLRVQGDRVALASAVEDLVRVAWVRAAGRRKVTLQCLRFGDEAVLTARAKAYDALLEHLPALMWRERPILLRRERVPMPLAGLAYAREVALASGGDLVARRDGDHLEVELRLPIA